MSGPTATAARKGNVVTVSLHTRGGWPTATRTAETFLERGETLERDTLDGCHRYRFRVIPATVLTLAEVRNAADFPRGTRFLVLPPTTTRSGR